LQYSDRIKNLTGNAIREIFKVISKPGVISFAGGLPATACLPVDKFKEYSQQLLQENGAAMLQYGATEGYYPFRECMAGFVSRCGIENVSTDNVLIISGGQQGLDLTFKAFINKDDIILVEDPTYLAVLHIAKTYQADVRGVRSDADGIDLNDLEQKIIELKPKIFYIVPNFSNPTGRTLPVQKRQAVAKLGEKYGVLILEDDPYRELRYSGSHLPSIKSFDESGHVLYVTSFSKTISPGMRVGAAVGAAEVVRKLTIGKQAVDVQTVTLMQAVAQRFITSGELDRHIAASVPVYESKKQAMTQAIARYMPESYSFSDPEGGLFIWGETPGKDCKQLFATAVEQGVAYVWGSEFYADGSGADRLRLNFSNATHEQIDEGIKRLAKVLA